MFRALGRPLFAQATRTVARDSRALSSTPCRLSDKPPPTLFGPGSPAGAVPSDEAQATGIERLQLLGRMAGLDVFNQAPRVLTKKGTMEDPIMVDSLAKQRIVGCTGFPQDSHDNHWIKVRHGKKGRCGECGQVFMLDYQGIEDDDHHHH